MKRIVNGVTYNTDTSTRIAEATWTNFDGEPCRGVLYQTLGGAFFIHHEVTKQIWNEYQGRKEEQIDNSFEPMNQADAHKWLMEGDFEVFHNPFDDPPEATAEAEPGATIYIRVPASLKKRVDEAAKEAELSGNAWAMRCVERCLAGSNDSSSPPNYVLKNPSVHNQDDKPRIMLNVADGWPKAMLTKSHAALLGRQLMKAAKSKA